MNFNKLVNQILKENLQGEEKPLTDDQVEMIRFRKVYQGFTNPGSKDYILQAFKKLRPDLAADAEILKDEPLTDEDLAAFKAANTPSVSLNKKEDAGKSVNPPTYVAPPPLSPSEQQFRSRERNA